MVKKNKQVSDGRLETMEASSSAAALVVENDSTKQPQHNCPKRKKTRAEMDKHNKLCRESRLRVKARKEKMETEKEAMQLELQELKNQNISYQEKISRLESDVQAFKSILQQKDEEIGRLKQSPSEWKFEELREQGIGNAGDVQEYLLESANYKQDGQDPGNESGNWAALGLTLSDLDDLDII